MRIKLKKHRSIHVAFGCLAFYSNSLSWADENLLGYVKGAETLPEGSWEIYQTLTRRADKDTGHYTAYNAKTEVGYGLTDRLSLTGNIGLQAIDTSGLIIDGYLPEDEKYSLRPSGVEVAFKYNFLKPALDDIGLATYLAMKYDWLDKLSAATQK